MLAAIPVIIFEFFYIVGSGVLLAFYSPKNFIREIKTIPIKLKRLQPLLKQFEFRRTIGIFVVLILIAGALIQGASLVALGQGIKQRVLGATDEGFKYLQDAKNAMDAEDVNKAQVNLAQALERFEQSEKEMGSGSAVLNGLLETIPQKRDADKLLEAAQLMTAAALDGTQALNLSKDLKVTPEGISSSNPETGSKTSGEAITELKSLIDDGSDKILKATELLSSVSVTTIPEDKRAAFLGVRDMLVSMQNSMLSLKEVGNILTSILLGKKNVLLVFQNNNELRPGGGFIGTVGKAHLSDGGIASLDIRSVYDFDGQMHEWILPPKQVLHINKRWYLRDSNWFADFGDSASSMIALYEKEGGETPDMVMAITPDLIVDMLKVTGPVTLPQYGVTLTSDNFIETTQTTTSIAYSKELNQPKQLLADFFPALMQKIGNQKENFIPVLGILQSNLRKKNILLYSTDDALQAKIESFNWAGRVRETDRDFLETVSSNMGGTKTDLFMKKNLDINSELQSDGTITNTVTYKLENPLPNKDGLQNMSFVRFLVPKGSTLNDSQGFIRIPEPELESHPYVSNPFAEKWDSELSLDGFSGIYSGLESEKSFFGGWVEVKGGESKTIVVKYTLPFQIKNLDRYSFLLLKQSGSNMSFVYTLKLNGRNVLWNNGKESRITDNQYKSEGQLDSDKYFGIVIQK